MSDNTVAQLLQLEQQIRRCESASELMYIMVNLTKQLLPYSQGMFLEGDNRQTLKLRAVSDLALVDRSTPFASWLEKIASWEDKQSQEKSIRVLITSSWEPYLQKDMAEFSPPNILWVPLSFPSNPDSRAGVLLLARSEPWSEREIGIAEHLASCYAHAMKVFKQGFRWRRSLSWLVSRKVQLAALIIFLGVAFIPVHLTVLAPAEIIARTPTLVTSPLAGAVKQVLVKPGDQVFEGQLVATLDKTEFIGLYTVAERELDKAKAELRTAVQAGYVDRKKKSDIAELESQVRLKQIELDYARKRLQQTDLLAQQDGVAILNDPGQWQGRPVVIGERILSIANPEQIQLEVLLPVKDAISLEKGSDVMLYLDTDPLNPLLFKIVYASFSAQLTPDQTVAYRLVSEPKGPIEETPRIGLRGSAKLFGEQVSLAYYLLRRPITFVRQAFGW